MMLYDGDYSCIRITIHHCFTFREDLDIALTQMYNLPINCRKVISHSTNCSHSFVIHILPSTMHTLQQLGASCNLLKENHQLLF